MPVLHLSFVCHVIFKQWDVEPYDWRPYSKNSQTKMLEFRIWCISVFSLLIPKQIFLHSCHSFLSTPQSLKGTKEVTLIDLYQNFIGIEGATASIAHTQKNYNIRINTPSLLWRDGALNESWQLQNWQYSPGYRGVHWGHVKATHQIISWEK